MAQTAVTGFTEPFVDTRPFYRATYFRVVGRTATGSGDVSAYVASWAAASSGSIATDATLEWTNVAATETYSHWSMWDALTSGNCLWTGALSSSAAVTAGDTFQITTLTLSLD